MRVYGSRKQAIESLLIKRLKNLHNSDKDKVERSCSMIKDRISLPKGIELIKRVIQLTET